MFPTVDAEDDAAIQAAYVQARNELLVRRSPDGHWVGHLSSSALSTATAVTAFAIRQRETKSAEDTRAIHAGLTWLARHQNADGGWGDTVISLSNISTTTLVWAAFGAVPDGDAQFPDTVRRAVGWLERHGCGVDPDRLATTIIARYGRDRTFSVPILTMCALSGRLGIGGRAWKHVIPLPYELAALPHQFFAAARLPVVSYALPALIAIGQARHRHAPSGNPFARAARQITQSRTLQILTQIQPTNGGFLEATPLTSFVTMSLAGSGLADHIVAQRGIKFLRGSQRVDGSWPIDTNLATWVTTLAVNALANCSEETFATTGNDGVAGSLALRHWLLSQQYRFEHPYTHAAPGGWAWTDLPGGVPDADDTAGALLALRTLGPVDDATRAAAQAGVQWLMKLQNRDGGIPTFCRGWGALPFDQSSPDITAHAIRAWLAWIADMPEPLQWRLRQAMSRALTFLKRSQRADGSWCPLWFGNEHVGHDENPLYGTARVLSSLAAVAQASGHLSAAGSPELFDPEPIARSALAWVVRAQSSEGGWGGHAGAPCSVEETSLAVEALALTSNWQTPEQNAAQRRGIQWLLARMKDGRWTRPAPIGFYFAKLWYFEELYPVIFTVGALREALQTARSKSSLENNG